jgi:hypothetical protein
MGRRTTRESGCIMAAGSVRSRRAPGTGARRTLALFGALVVLGWVVSLAATPPASAAPPTAINFGVGSQSFTVPDGVTVLGVTATGRGRWIGVLHRSDWW